jgi:hypothetical protein
LDWIFSISIFCSYKSIGLRVWFNLLLS